MNNDSMIEKLKKVGISFTNGLSDKEIQEIEATFGFRFPKEIASFLSCAYPTGEDFFNYRDMSSQNIKAFHDFQQNIQNTFLFDLEHNMESLQELLQDMIGSCANKDEFQNAVLTALKQSPRLIPFYAHRCFIDGMDNMPIISFWQAVDTIFYGSNFENYLGNEFLHPKNYNDYGKIPDEMKNTGIWYYIIEW